MFRRTRILLAAATLTAVLGFGTAKVASAETQGNATWVAATAMHQHCADFWHGCENDAYQWPVCHYSGVNIPGHVEWNCYGKIIRLYYPLLQQETWTVYVGVGPYGGVDAFKQWKSCNGEC